MSSIYREFAVDLKQLILKEIHPMTVQAVNQFLDKVAEDPKLQEELTKILETQGSNDRVAATQLGVKQGYQFTPDELWQEVQRRQSEFTARQAAGQLNDEELEAVAGGGGLGSDIAKATVKATGKITVTAVSNPNTW